MIFKFMMFPRQLQQIIANQEKMMATLEDIGTDVTALGELIKEAITLLKQEEPDVHQAEAKLQAADEKIQSVITGLADVAANPPSRVTQAGPTGDAPQVPTTHVSEGSAS